MRKQKQFTEEQKLQLLTYCHSESLGATHVALCTNIHSYSKYWWNVYARSPLRQYSFLHHTLEQEY